jgi:transcription elongation factor GreA
MSANIYYVSQEAFDAMKAEVALRKGEARRKLAEEIGTAKEQGDLSENFEYQDAKERQAGNEGEILRLLDKIAKASIVEKRSGESTIGLGSTFVVKTEKGDEKTFSIVGATESDPMTGKISNESPFGNAFLGHESGDDIEFEAPAGVIKYTVISIE